MFDDVAVLLWRVDRTIKDDLLLKRYQTNNIKYKENEVCVKHKQVPQSVVLME